jgi:predicted permease
MLRSLSAVMHVSPGFDPSHVLTAHVPLADHRYPTDAQAGRFCNALLDRLSQIGGVESASISTGLPMMDSLNVSSFRVEGAEVLNNGHPPETDIKMVSEDYFRTAGVPLVRGRGFTRQDAAEANARVIVINQRLADMLSRYGDPVGRTLIFGQGKDAPHRTIVGIVAGAHEMGLEEEIRPEVFVPGRQIGSIAVMLRAKGDPLALSGALTAAVWSIDKDQTVSDIKTLAEHFHSTTAQRRFDTLLFGGFAGLALLLAALGLYGVLSYSVMLRRRELGVRMALGARAGDVARLVVGNGLGLTLTGVAIGAVGAFALTRLMENIVFGVSTSDPLTFAAVAAVLALVGLAACYTPARRAAAIDPVNSLRAD